MKRSKVYVCKKIRLCKYLLDKGFVFFEQRPDRNDPKFHVWIFPNSEELEESVTAYYNRLNQWKADNEKYAAIKADKANRLVTRQGVSMI